MQGAIARNLWIEKGDDADLVLEEKMAFEQTEEFFQGVASGDRLKQITDYCSSEKLPNCTRLIQQYKAYLGNNKPDDSQAFAYLYSRGDLFSENDFVAIKWFLQTSRK
jgi:hypothetical protein